MILLVEDTRDLAAEIRDLLLMEGFEVELARNGQEALDVLDKRSPRLIITDLVMPVMDGFEFVSHVKNRQQFNGVGVILLTARADESTSEQAKALGIERVLSKPCRAEALLGAVRSLIAC